MKYEYPACRTAEGTEDWFGVSLPDPYAWLKQAGDVQVLDFVARENAFTDAWFDADRLQAKIAQLKADKLPELYYSLTRFKDGYLAAERREGKPFIRIVDARTNQELCKYNLNENYTNMTAMIFGEVYRYNGEWKFNAIGQATTDPGLGELVGRYV